MIDQTAGLAVRHTVTVEAPPERAFEVFTAGFTSWWPLTTHHIGDQTPVEEVLEPFPGGRCYERAADGTECDWGRVLAWEPPHRLLLSWEVSSQWKHARDVASEVEILFSAEDGGRTVVALEHRGLEVYGDRAQEMRDIFGSDGGWPGLLQRFAAAADAP